MDLEIRMVDIDHVNALRAYLRRRVRFALGRFSRSVRRVTVRAVSETREDVGAEVQITVTLLSGVRIVLIERAPEWHVAFDAAVDRLARTSTRRIERTGLLGLERAMPRTSA